MGNKLNVSVLIYPGVQLVDMNGPIDVFLHANAYNDAKYNVFTVAETTGILQSEGDAVQIKPEYDLHNCPHPDIIVIPGQILAGGANPKIGEGSKAIIDWIRAKAADKNVIIMSVCVGAYILAKTGLLANKSATTHYLSLQSLQGQYPDIKFVKNVRFIEDGRLVTTGGITSGIDGALHLVKKLDGAVNAQHVADVLIYNRDAALPPYTLLPPYDD
jgi:transcriptional regulator GlxA family with amidase domain